MPHIIMPQVYCPLCDKPMVRRMVQYEGKTAAVYFCQPCKIGIYEFDPAFNKWRDTDKVIPCPHCGFEALKWFARYMDGYFKGVCPRCHTVVQKDGDVKFTKHGEIIIPEDMEEDNEPPIQIHIPISKLKGLGEDKKNELRNKFKQRREQNGSGA